MILEVFSTLSDSLILWLKGGVPGAWIDTELSIYYPVLN